MMISDEERRAVARRMRYELRLMYRDREYYESGKNVVECGNWTYRSIARSVIPCGHLGNDYIGAVERLADLIDRPMTRNLSEKPEFVCELCGAVWPYDLGFTHCPECGAEVAE